MTSLAAQLGIEPPRHPMRDAFLGWQCRARQMMMRDNGGKPTDAVMPAVTLAGESEPMGHIITVMSKIAAHGVRPELVHMAKRTPDTAKWRADALTFFSATYYQKAKEFSDILTATFQPGSEGAAAMRGAQHLTLTYEAYGQRYDVACRVWKLARKNPLYAATVAHNRLFNPALHPETEVLGFEPDWDASTAEPPVGGR